MSATAVAEIERGVVANPVSRDPRGSEPGLLVEGAVFLGEELYETGVVARIIQSGDARGADGRSQAI